MDTIREADAGKNHPGLIGTRVDRFVVVEKLGAGGMGEVYLATDPQLNRQVAIKLLKRSPDSDDRAMDQLLIEARAMAQVSHPNVVSVFDAGMHGEQPWVAMEWIRGRTLRDWLKTPHPWMQTLTLLCAAGRGLQAAHEAGLVHRDFKPENVLVGDNGRVAVTDFGLAHAALADARPELATPTAVPGASQSGLLRGTPGYMAPEQLTRQATDARTDQFAFAVTAYEALYGALPFDGEPGTPKPPPASKVNPRVWRALERALHRDLLDRHPTMQALLAELEGALPRGRRGLGLAFAAVAVLVTAATTFIVSRPQACDTGPKLVAPIWNAQRKAAVQTSLQSTPVGTTVGPQVLEQLESYVHTWTAMEQQSCEATRAGSQSPALLDLRMACLRRRLSDLDAVVSLLASEGGALAAKADSAVGALTSVEGCADATTLDGRLAIPAASRAAVEALDQSLSRVKAMEDLGQYRDALEPAKAQVVQARAVGYAPALAEALVELARTQNLSGKAADAEPTFEDAVNTAEIARDDRLRAHARLLRVQLLIGLRKLGDAERELKATAAVVERVGSASLTRQLKVTEADLANVQGRLDDAVKLAKQALDIVERLDPPDERQRVAAIGTYAFSLMRMARLADASKQYERALAIGDRVMGPKNPALAKLLSEYAAVLGKLRKLELARPMHARAQEIILASVGPDAPMMGEELNNWGVALLMNRDLEGAKAAIERGLEIRRKNVGPDDFTLSPLLNSLGVIAAETGKYDDAVIHFREGLRIRELTYGPSHPRVLSDLSDLAGAYSLGGKHVESLAVFDDAVARDKKAVGSRMADSAKAMLLMGRGEELLKLFRFAEARAQLTESHDNALKAEGPDLPGRQRLLEAMVAWDGFGEREAATALAKGCKKDLDEIGDPDMINALAGLTQRMKAGKRNTR